MRNTIIKKLSLCLAVLIGFAAAAHSVGAAITIDIDGNLDDWNININTATSGTNPGTVYNGFGGIAGFKGAHVEDTNDLSNNYQVGPNYGGQNYDAEFLGVAVQDNTLLIGILSGQRPDNGLSKYSPGDIRIITDGPGGSRIFGIEVGGGIYDTDVNGNPVVDNGDSIVHEGDPGTFYTLYSNGYTQAVTTDANKLAGQLWETPNALDWYLDPIGAPASTQLQLNLLGGTLLGTADFVFTRNSDVDDDGDTIDANPDNKQHSVIELALGMDTFGLGNDEKIISVEWRPSCGNDELIVTPTGGFGPDVPEPASILVWGLLSVACAGFGFRRRSRRCVE